MARVADNQLGTITIIQATDSFCFIFKRGDMRACLLGNGSDLVELEIII